MIKILLLLVYMWGDDVVVEKKYFDTQQECAIAGGQRMQAISIDPKFREGYFGGCIEVKVQQAAITK